MSDDGTEPSLSATGPHRSVIAGDIPTPLKRRYLTEQERGGLAYYVDHLVTAPAFRDRGAQLIATRTDPRALRDMAAIAAHRGWTTVAVTGSKPFRREAWKAAQDQGLAVVGYAPTSRDVQAFERRTYRIQERSADARDSSGQRRPAPPPEDRVLAETFRAKSGRGAKSQELHGANDRLAIVEAATATLGADKQAHAVERARLRIANWLERGARFDPGAGPSTGRLVEEPGRKRERQRSL